MTWHENTASYYMLSRHRREIEV